MKTITVQQAQSIIDYIELDSNKKWLACKWAIDIVLGNQIHVDDVMLSTLRGKPEIGYLLNEIFGKEFPPNGTPCLVRDSRCCSWKLAYADGDGRFYEASKKLGILRISWSEWQVLNINNLPVNE